MPYKRKRTRRNKKAKRNVRRRLQSRPKRTDYQKYAGAAMAGAKYAYQAASMYNTYKKEQAKYQKASPQIEQDYRRVRVGFGRKISTAKRARKLTRQNINTNIYTLRNYGAWGRGSGNVTIGSYQPGLAGTEIMMPVHMWDLTTLPQGRSSSTVHPNNFYELAFTNETSSGNPNWYTYVNGVYQLVTGLSDAAVGYTEEYQLYQTYTRDADNITIPAHEGGADSFIEKFNAQIVLNGPTQKACKWCIQLVQLSDEVTPGVDTGSEVYRNFWQQMAKPYGFSPIETGPRMELRKHLKVLKSYYCNMDSPESNEDHLNARVQHVDFRGHLNRKCNYRWDFRGDGVNLSADDVPEDTQTTVFSTHVHPRARVYIMIRALCQQRLNQDWAASFFPSYDIKLDVYHKSLE